MKGKGKGDHQGNRQQETGRSIGNRNLVPVFPPCTPIKQTKRQLIIEDYRGKQNPLTPDWLPHGLGQSYVVISTEWIWPTLINNPAPINGTCAHPVLRLIFIIGWLNLCFQTWKMSPAPWLSNIFMLAFLGGFHAPCRKIQNFFKWIHDPWVIVASSFSWPF